MLTVWRRTSVVLRAARVGLVEIVAVGTTIRSSGEPVTHDSPDTIGGGAWVLVLPDSD